jgi:hypothetical protein
MLISDNGTLKKVGADSLKTYFQSGVSAAGFGTNSYNTGSAAQSLSGSTGIWYANSETLESSNALTLHLSGSWSTGDNLIIKAPANADQNSLTVLPLDSGDEVEGHMIDGDQSGLILNSPHAAVNIIYAGNGSWLVY